MEPATYNQQHLEAFRMVRRHLKGMTNSQMDRLRRQIDAYLTFRRDVSTFQDLHFSKICIDKCFTSKESACCGREGIAAFFADVVINALLSTDAEIDCIIQNLLEDKGDPNCVYLTQKDWNLEKVWTISLDQINGF